jgi:hypothetical protein
MKALRMLCVIGVGNIHPLMISLICASSVRGIGLTAAGNFLFKELFDKYKKKIHVTLIAKGPAKLDGGLLNGNALDSREEREYERANPHPLDIAQQEFEQNEYPDFIERSYGE